jgi:tRNA G18 (ribose-2'-O)-methylase SpoU
VTDAGRSEGPEPDGDARASSDVAADGEPWIDDFRALNDPARRREVERRGDFFVVEGLFALEALVASSYPLRSLLVADNKLAAVHELIAPTPGVEEVPLVVRSPAELVAITGFAFHRGVLATARRLPPPPVDEVVAGARRLLVVEGVNDHENLGALFRNAAALGIEGVVLDPTTADPLYRRSVRVSLGHVLRVPWSRCARWPAGLDDLRARGVTNVALTPASDAVDVDELAADPPERVAFLVGAEGPGLSPGALAAADRRVRIPVAEGVDSLNVATAAAIAFHRLALLG